MIRFFQHIKNRLPDQNRISKYLVYAVGEIALVMIGILLALQVNNWNENRRADIKEKSILANLSSELESSLQELRSDYGRIKVFHESTLKVKNYLEEKTPLSDSMYSDFYKSFQFSYFFPKTSTYETIKAGNLENIQSENLRMLITDIYETGYNRIITKINTRRNASRVLYPYYQKHFRTVLIPGKDVIGIDNYQSAPNDYEFLLTDSEYESLISEAILGRTMEVIDYQKTILLVEEGIQQIDKYLSSN